MLVREWVAQTSGQGWQYYFNRDALCPFQWHYHPEYELTFTRYAEGLRYIGSDVDEFADCDLALVAPNQPHTWQARANTDGALQEVQVVFFTRAWLEQLAAHGAPEVQQFCLWLDRLREGVVFSRPTSLLLAPAFARLHTLRGLPRLSCLLEILSALPADEAARPLQGKAAGLAQDRRLQAALVCLQQQYRSPVTLEDVARAGKTSVGTMKRLFAEQMQTSFSELLAQLRIGHACNLLLTSQMSIPALAQASGFPSLSHFYRKFGEMKGESPAAFRERYRLVARA